MELFLEVLIDAPIAVGIVAGALLIALWLSVEGIAKLVRRLRSYGSTTGGA